MGGYFLDAVRTQRLFLVAAPEERSILAFLCLAMFQQENCAEYIRQDDIDMAKTLFKSEDVDAVVDRWFIKHDDMGSYWTCVVPIGIDTNEY